MSPGIKEFSGQEKLLSGNPIPVLQLFSRKIGQGPPLIILHGLFGSSDNWQTFAKMVSDRYQVITLDLRNHGLSPQTEEFDYDLMSEDLFQFVREHQLSSFYLMGHSMGGKTAATFALKYPQLVSKLVLLDIAMKSYPPHHEIYFEAMRSLDFDTIKTRNEADTWLQKWITSVPVRQFILKNLVRDDAGRFRWRFNLESLYKNYSAINIAIEHSTPFTSPTLLVSGEYSNYIATEDIDEMRKLFPDLTYKIVAQAGHWIHADQPESLKQIVLEFLG